MSRQRTKDELLQHKEDALKKLESYMDSLINDANSKMNGKSDKLSYWLEDWTTFLEYEPIFSPKSLRRYKRGEIVKAHLGFNVGSEEGGLHYCVVLDNDNPISTPVVTVVPLTSVKKKTDLSKLKKGSVYLGNEIFTNLISKFSIVDKTLSERISRLQTRIDSIDAKTTHEDIKSIKEELDIAKREQELLNRMRTEVLRMKIGSIALTNQIRTISKIRIYDPKTNHDILSGVKLSNEKLDLIDNEIIGNFTKKK